jgi:hypothetical protein
VVVILFLREGHGKDEVDDGAEEGGDGGAGDEVSG